MTLKNNRVPLQSNIKLCASVHYHMWIKTWVMVRKRLRWIFTSVTLTFDWSLPFITSPKFPSFSSTISKVTDSLLNLENHGDMFLEPSAHMDIPSSDRHLLVWTNPQHDRRTDWTIQRAAWSQLKTRGLSAYKACSRFSSVIILVKIYT